METLRSSIIAPGLKHSPINGYYHPDDPGEPGTDEKRLSISDQEGRILASLVRGLVVLDIGTGLGVSARYMATTANHVITVDNDPWVIEMIFPTLPPEVIGAPGYQEWFPQFGAAFLDGSHLYPQVVKDIQIMRQRVKPGGLMIFHDLYIRPVFNALRDNGVNFIHIETKAGLGVAWNE